MVVGIDVEVLVVGGGIAGLAAAVGAARAGRSVHLVEAHQLGGRAQSDQRRGFTFNRGPHALYDRGAGRRVLRSFGIGLTGARAPVSEARGLRGGTLSLLPGGPVSLARTDLLSAGSKVAFTRVLASLARTDPVALATMSTTEWVRSVSGRDDVVALLEALVRLSTYASDLGHLSADAAVAQLRLATRGVTYLDGGWQSIVDALAGAARAAGAEVSTGTPATGLEPGADLVEAAVDGRVLRARAVVLAAGGPGLAARLTGGAVPDDLGPAVEATCVDYGLHTPPPVPFVLGIDEPLYLSRHAPRARLAPEGGAVVCGMHYGSGGPAAVERIDRLVEQAGITPDAVAERRVLASMTVAHAMPRPGPGLVGRPPVAVPGRPRCFVAGDWVGPEGLLGDAALSSGSAAGRAAAAC